MFFHLISCVGVLPAWMSVDDMRTVPTEAGEVQHVVSHCVGAGN